MYIIGIDPGKSGGIAWSWGELDRINARPMPATERDIVAQFETFEPNESVYAYLERVHTMPGQGIASSGKFMQHYGFLRGVLVALGIPFEEVSPLKWQRALGCLSGGDKNVTKQKAQQLFPHLTITHKTADALLIAEYGRRLYVREKK